MILAVLATVIFNLRSRYHLGRVMLVEQRPDAILHDVGQAVGQALLLALRDAGLLDGNIPLRSVCVVEKPEGYEVSLSAASPENAALFVRSYRQIFAPVREQRYLILRQEDRLPNVFLRPLWRLLRRYFRNPDAYPPAYHPVPDALDTRKERAEAFSRHWQRRVGGGALVYTRTGEGRRKLLAARAQRRPETKDLAFEVWK